MRAETRLLELLDALRAARLYRSPELVAAAAAGSGGPCELDTRSNDYLGLAASTVEWGDGLLALSDRAGGAAGAVVSGIEGASSERYGDEASTEGSAGGAELAGSGERSLAECERSEGRTGARWEEAEGAEARRVGTLVGSHECREPVVASHASERRGLPAPSPARAFGYGEREDAAPRGGYHSQRPVSRETVETTVPPPRSGAGASRLVSGTTAEHVALERELAEWLGTEAALVFSSAYAANLGLLSALALEGDVIFSDELNHASIIDGCRLSRAETVVVPHRDLAALGAALARPRAERSVRWVITESYFSMDGTSPELPALRELCDRYEAALIVDETHSLGVFGPEGRGLAAEAAVRPDLLVGGLGKALGLQGGFVAGPLAFHQWLWNRARSFVFSTGVSPWLCARARVHLRYVRAADAQRARLASLATRLERDLSAAGIPAPPGRHGPLFPVIFGTETAALAAAEHLAQLGVRAQPIRPPTVPRGSARLRLSLRADMSDAQLELLTASLLAAWGKHQTAARVSLSAHPAAAPEPSPEIVAKSGPSEQRPLSSGPAARRSSATLGPQPRWVILGTGTGVGKSYVAQALVRALAEAGPVAGLKPIETGCRTSRDGRPRDGDAALLEAASVRVKHPRPHPLYGFREPIAPSLAALREGQNVDVDAVASWADRVRCQGPGVPALVIETAGGVFSPLSDRATNFELARTLGDACWILVAPDRLGVLHDVTGTLRAMAALGRSPDLLVLSAPAEQDASSGSNAGELRRLGLAIPLIELGRDQPLELATLRDAGFRPAAE